MKWTEFIYYAQSDCKRYQISKQVVKKKNVFVAWFLKKWIGKGSYKECQSICNKHKVAQG